MLIHSLSYYRLFENGYCFHLYTLEGIPIKHFAHIGQGPGELLSANLISSVFSERLTNMYDSASRKLVFYYLQTDLILDMPYREYRLDYHLYFLLQIYLMLFMICLLLHKRNV